MESLYLRALRHHWLLVVVLALVGSAVALGVALTTPASYRADATLFLKVQSKDSSLYERSQFAQQRIKSYGSLIDSPALLGQVISELRLDTTPGQLAARVDAVNPDSTVLLVVSATAETPRAAVRLVTAAARALSAEVNGLENGRAGSSDVVDLQLQYVADPPTRPVSPNLPVIVGLGLLVGLVLGVVLALLAEAARPRVRTAADVRRVTGLPLVAVVPRSASAQWARPTTQLDKATASAYVDFVHGMKTISRGRALPLVALVPAGRGAASFPHRVTLARAFATTGRSVVLVESAPSASLAPLGLAADAEGLAQLVDGSRRPDDVAKRVGAGGYDLVPAGGPIPAVDLERRLPEILDELASAYDVALVQLGNAGAGIEMDTAPSTIRGAFVVSSYRRTTESALRHTTSALELLGITPLGVIMVDAPSWGLPLAWQSTDAVDVVIEAEQKVGERVGAPSTAGLATSSSATSSARKPPRGGRRRPAAASPTAPVDISSPRAADSEA